MEPATDAKDVQIFATNERGERFELLDLYWFEEQGIRAWDDVAVSGSYLFEIVIKGVTVARIEQRHDRRL